MPYKRLILLLLIGMSGCVSWFFYQHQIITSEQFFQYIENYPVWAPIIYVVATVISNLLLLPLGLPLNLGAGIVWGMFWGGVLTSIAATLSAIFAYFIARYFAQNMLTAYIHKKGWEKLLHVTRTHDWQLIFLTRVNPLIPFCVMNYLFGLTTISFTRYIIVTIATNMLLCFTFSGIGSSIATLKLTGNLHRAMIELGLALLAGTAIYFLRLVLGKKTNK